MNVDVVCLQEYPVQSPHRTNLLNHLKAVTGVQWYESYIGTTSSTSEDEGNAVLSRHPITATNGTGYLPRSNTGGRSIAHATVNFKGKTVNLFSTHLDSDGGSSNAVWRGYQVQDILAITERTTNPFAQPRIICGDFNMSSGASQLDPIQAVYYDAWEVAFNAVPKLAFAYPDNPVAAQTRTRGFRIDYGWYSKTSNLTLLKATVFDTRDPLTYNTTPGAPTNSQGHPLAYGLYTDSILNTTDDKGIRPSDHNMFINSYTVP
jgi:endonuclease/exonuclease/phosphatase family metal-dependent hydrolase